MIEVEEPRRTRYVERTPKKPGRAGIEEGEETKVQNPTEARPLNLVEFQFAS